MFTASFQLDARDLTAGNRLHFRRRLWPCLLQQIPVVLVISAASWLTDGEMTLAAFGLTLAITAAIYLPVFLIIMLIIYLMIPAKSRKLLSQQKILQDPVDMEWSESHITFRSPRSHLRMAWPEFIACLADRTSILLLHSDLMFQVIPCRALSPEHADSIRRFAAGKPG